MAKRQKKRRTKPQMMIYILTVIVLAVTILSMTAVMLFRIQEIHIKGNENIPNQMIISTLEDDKWSVNSLYLMGKVILGKQKKPEGIRSMSVSLENPWTVEVEVKEKQIVGYLMTGDNRIYFDKDGFVMAVTIQQKENVPKIEGLEPKSAALYEKMEIKEQEVFDRMIELIDLLEETKLEPERILVEDEALALYFDNIYVPIGKGNYKLKIQQIPPILEQLAGQEGTLNLEHFEQAGQIISFEKGVLPSNEETSEQNNEGTNEQTEVEDNENAEKN